MSDLRIALIAEGATDAEVIRAALKAVLDTRPFILTQLQPEATRPELGSGWCGVRKWCRAAGLRHSGPIDADPTLRLFDLLIIHLDVDVAGFAYADCGQEAAAQAELFGWPSLPCAQPCPPVESTVYRLEAVLKSWLGAAQLGRKAVLCMPAQSSEAWLAAAVLPSVHQFGYGLECVANLETRLSSQPKHLRVKKTQRDYRSKASNITDHWETVKAQCSQAAAFEKSLLDLLAT